MSTDKSFLRNCLLIKKLSKKATIPTQGSDKAAGFDLYSAYKYVVPGRGKCLIKTDIQIRCPNGTYGRIAPRSGMAWNKHTDIGAGVIDSDYRGNICVILFNHSNKPFIINSGDRVAQLICEKIKIPKVIEVQKLSNTTRNNNNFGSTGK